MDILDKKDLSKEGISMSEIKVKMKECFVYLRSIWYIFIFLLLLGGGLGYLYSMIKRPIYTATTTFVLEAGESSGVGGLSQYAGIASMVGVDLGGASGGIFQGDNLLELYKSRTMIASTLLQPSSADSTKLILDNYLSIDDTKEEWKKEEPQLLEINFSLTNQTQLQRKRDSIINEVVENINRDNLIVTKLDKKLSIIKVDVTSKDELFSKEFNEALVQNVNDFYVETKSKKSLQNISILQHKTDSVRAVMLGSISASAFAIDATPNLNPTKQAQRIIPTQRSQFSAETNKAILSHLVQNLELSKMSLLKETPLIQVVDQPIFPLKKEYVSILKGIALGCLAGVFLFLIYGFVGFLIKR